MLADTYAIAITTEMLLFHLFPTFFVNQILLDWVVSAKYSSFVAEMSLISWHISKNSASAFCYKWQNIKT